MLFKVSEPGIEVSGECIGAIVDAFKLFPSLPLKLLAKNGLAHEVPGKKELVVDRTAWHSIESWFAVYEALSAAVGNNALFKIGESLPGNAVFPHEIRDLESGLKSLDMAYHMNHRKNGVVMFNPQTGTMLEGIGHYRVKRTLDKNRIEVWAENPYPCDFDRGIVTAMSKRFEARASIVEKDSQPCRKKGANHCTYIVQW